MYDPSEIDGGLFKKADIVMFDDYEMECPDLAWLERGKVKLSDQHQGVVNWNARKKQYQREYYCTSRLIGQFTGILIEEEKSDETN